jgi:hypothetical protein
MKIIALVFTLLSSSAFAADFPTGSFRCEREMNETQKIIVHVKIEEQIVGSISLPVIEYSNMASTYKLDGPRDKRGLSSVNIFEDGSVSIPILELRLAFHMSADKKEYSIEGYAKCVKL